MRKLLFGFIFFLHVNSYSQAVERFLSDSVLLHASYSMYVADAGSGITVLNLNSGKNVTPASVQKLITSAAALELLGPDYTFRTQLGYTGKLTRRGKLNGNLIIKGGGDPTLASPDFTAYYGDFPDKWIDEIKKAGIKKITGKVITDDSYYDYLPVPSKWLWEDAGNYYGAGVYGASVYDNTYDIHFKTSSDGTNPVITRIIPEECNFGLTNRLVASGTTDKGYVFAAPYSKDGWLAGSIPVDSEDFVLSAAIPDPPLLIAVLIDKKLRLSGVKIEGSPTTMRLENLSPVSDFVSVSEYVSPPLSDIVEVLNHKSVNLYAEHLVKELGKKFRGSGSTAAGIEVITSFADSIGVRGMLLFDGSGLSRANSINAEDLASILVYMKNHGRYFEYYQNSFPVAGREGTMKNFFRDEVFSDLKAKSGSMSGVRSYAGYFTTKSGRDMVFAFMTNNFDGPSGSIVSHYEEILKEIILTY
jgi:D-alanyl-D-alanine carboxypeptidase/D-alanyl-D-alanine-endopeptidase (penicillin-binding protein 4)